MSGRGYPPPSSRGARSSRASFQGSRGSRGGFRGISRGSRSSRGGSRGSFHDSCGTDGYRGSRGSRVHRESHYGDRPVQHTSGSNQGGRREDRDFPPSHGTGRSNRGTASHRGGHTRKRSRDYTEDRERKRQRYEKPFDINTQTFYGETSIPCCKTGTPTIFSYLIEISPPIHTEGGIKTSIRVKNDIYTFDKFMIFSHQEVNVPPCVFQCDGKEHIATLVRIPGLESLFDYERSEWFHQFFFHHMLDLYTWLLPNQQTSARFSSCRMFHFFPQFLKKTNGEPGKPSILHPFEVKEYFTNHCGASLFKIIKFVSKRHENDDRATRHNHVRLELKDQIIYSTYHKTHYRIDDIDFDASPNTLFIPFGDTNVRSISHVIEDRADIKVFDKQPLLVHNQLVTKVKKLAHTYLHIPEYDYMSSSENSPYWSKQTFLYLVPELCMSTGVRSDMTNLGLLLPTITDFMRSCASLSIMENRIGIQFQQKDLLAKAMTHPSYVEAFSAHAHSMRCVYSKVGCFQTGSVDINQPFRRTNNTKELIKVMDRAPVENPGFNSVIQHNQRLEFLGDAVLEYISTTKLFLMLPEHREGKLTLFRTACVSNKTISRLADELGLSKFLRHANFTDMSKEGKIRDGMLADAFEALLGTIYIDQGFSAVRTFYGQCMFNSEEDADLFELWNLPLQDPLQALPIPPNFREEEAFKKIEAVEDLLGFTFKNPMLLLQAFTHPSLSADMGVLFVGNNQRLEFLGDAVVEMIVSQYLFSHFPEHQEGQLTLLRTALVNNRTMAEVSTILGLYSYLRYLPAAFTSDDEKNDDRSIKGMLADCFEAIVGAIFLDQGIDVAEAFINVVLLSRIEQIILDREWMGPKGKLRQALGSGKSRPLYKTISTTGPSHYPLFTVGVYWKNKLFCEGTGHSVGEAENDAAKNGLVMIDK